jgi:hypothetical protein
MERDHGPNLRAEVELDERRDQMALAYKVRMDLTSDAVEVATGAHVGVAIHTRRPDAIGIMIAAPPPQFRVGSPTDCPGVVDVLS